ncbi:uncharacterized protein KY384_005551 [Bacidia gigantensis]|uniref:uncharacterized protein n=1 Tax=Bacidia gigantensis TaxID=2732470 RepID=UPI001D040ED3|nr:uncharacterized protein KY384_005551 [Bacidia gigantensis]KAG8530069.1 hypothetical protein KY384_005551 [Bacidia gigantensis]
MPTIIVGAGIIGVSSAYYLSELDPSKAHDIHLVESSPELFASASGFAAGFLAADWFSSPLAKLGALSFKLHMDIAETNNGQERWGYSQSTGTNLAETIESNEDRDSDWLREGASRARAAANTEPESGNAPQWLKSKGALDVLSGGDTTAQILVIAAGAWSPSVFRTLFPTSKLSIPITSLSGHSLLLRSKHWPPPALDATDPIRGLSSSPSIPVHHRKDNERQCHAIFTTDTQGGYSPELFSRMPNGEIYLAGLNSPSYPLPKVANERTVDSAAINTLKVTARRLLGDDVEVVRESVCWRPVSRRGVPVICELTGKVGDKGNKDGSDEGGGEGVFLAAGHGAWGISLSLGTGWCVARMVAGEDMSEYVGRLGI